MKSGTINDQQLLEWLCNRQRSEAGIARLYALYADEMARLVQAGGGTYADGQDVFQDVVLAFVYSVQQDRYRGEAGIRTYLSVLTRHKWYNELRRRGRAEGRAERYEADRPALDEGTVALLEHKEATAALKDVLAATGEGCRALLTGFYYGGKSMKELADEAGLGSEQAARNKKVRCLKKLAERLEAAPSLARQLKNLLYGPF
ncbi:RNA polymerase sigma factor [Flaviaesturariibacter aridisoli]|uniref:Sigma-70 family RNA polymerase sigma factor n=1 Tax=Flaviaesturariibacter aridisoli TaxID=2545761 RepID=A0A4R4E7N4_9BACT|nr:sigma-70 family RNA polymerase sigma factor [Flaviaesturariibacter aridisoli]TCZ74933.1 sigma-70 family RNA polymerase sigma factor [Flaviaesturariibacter aridisoli]